MEYKTGSRIEREFDAYGQWREALSDAITQYREWLREQDLSEAQCDLQLSEVLGTLHDNRLYVAFVAEYSRGKSELINGIFFGGLGKRVLPSTAGRTTMCPNELLHEPNTKPSIRLLPIETRKSGTPLVEYKNFADEWTEIGFDPSDPDDIAKALLHLTNIKTVPMEEAQELGLHVAKDEAHDDGMHITEEGKVEIPTWRHAIINFPHPMLDQGLVILDTPGLNALGAEPELTLNLLSSAHGVLFVLSADAGVTKSDMAVWRDHICGSERSTKGVLVALNKIDVLWDELRDPEEVEQEIKRQIETTAKTLGIEENRIFPVSAQKALLGKIRGDAELLAQSRIEELEGALADILIPAKREIVCDNVRQSLNEIYKTMRLMLAQRVRGVNDHLQELDGLNNKNTVVIENMMDKVKQDKEHLEKSLQRFHATRSIFSQQTNLLYTHLNIKNLESLVAETKKNMAISLTTAGIKKSMEKFFVQAESSLKEGAIQAREIKTLMEGVYRKFQEEHGLAKIKPGAFSTTKYLRELKEVKAQYEQFLSGMSLVMTEQMTVVNKFYVSVVSGVKRIFEKANKDADNWLKTIMSPMETQVREHQMQLRRRLESIKRIHKATDSLDDRLGELRAVEEGFRMQEAKMEELIAVVTQRLEYDDNITEIRVEETA